MTNVSQERLSEIRSLIDIAKYVNEQSTIRKFEFADKIAAAESGLKHLQAIEAERDRYKRALENIASTPEIEEGSPVAKWYEELVAEATKTLYGGSSNA